jgi:hypothetical protein
MKKTKFKIQQGITMPRYKKLDSQEFDGLCEKLYKQNREWFRQETSNNPTVTGILVVGKKLEEVYHTNGFPSYFEIQRRSQTEGKKVFLLTRPNPYLDLVLYFQTKNSEMITELLKREKQDVKSYLEPVEGISQLNCQSGLLNNIEDAFAIGELKYEKTLIRQSKPELGRYEQGATVATIEHPSYKMRLRITSQSEKEVHLRRAKTIEEKRPGNWERIERLHRFDDPILDIFDTYEMKKRENWPDLLVYKSKK